MTTEPICTFGKFKGRTIKSLLNTCEGLDYVRWLAHQTMASAGKVRAAAFAARDALKKARL